MKRKDLKVGETYYVTHRKGTKERIFIDKTETVLPFSASKVLALEPYGLIPPRTVDRNRNSEFVEIQKGNTVLVEQTYYENGVEKTRRNLVKLTSIICPLDEAVKQITENRNAQTAREIQLKEYLAARDKYDREVFTPCFNAFTTALTKLHVSVRDNGTPRRYDRDTRLGSMPLDVVEVLTVIIKEALAKKEEENA